MTASLDAVQRAFNLLATSLAERGVMNNDHEEVVMNPIRRICQSTVIAAGLAVALLTSGTLSPAANAIIVPPPGGPAGPVNVPTQLHNVAAGGMPGWQITLIATGAAILAAAAAVLLDRAHTARRHLTTPNS